MQCEKANEYNLLHGGNEELKTVKCERLFTPSPSLANVKFNILRIFFGEVIAKIIYSFMSPFEQFRPKNDPKIQNLGQNLASFLLFLILSVF